MKAVCDLNLGMDAVVEVSPERAKLPSPSHTVAGSPVHWIGALHRARLWDTSRASPRPQPAACSRLTG